MTDHQHKEAETDSCLFLLPKDIKLLMQSLKGAGFHEVPQKGVLGLGCGVLTVKVHTHSGLSWSRGVERD